MSAKPAFRLPERRRDAVDDWVSGATAELVAPEEPKPKVKLTRLTIDLDPQLHARFKSTCALRGTNMVDEVRGFIDRWIDVP